MNRKTGIVGLVLFVLLGSVGIATYLYMGQPQTINLVKLGQIDTGGQAEFVEVVGDIAYVIDVDEQTPGGLVLVNVSDSRNPVEISSFHDGGRPFEFAVDGNYVYVADAFEGLEIIDVSDPENPDEIAQYEGSGEIYDVQIVGDIAYVADWNWGLTVLNVSDPASPEYVTRKSITGSCIHVDVEDDLIFASDHRSEETGLVIYNISNPVSPMLVGSYLPEYDIWNPRVVDHFAYVGNHGLSGGEMRILNVSVPNDIQETSILESGGTIFSIVVENNIAYAADYQLGLIVMDVSDPTAPTLIGHFYDGGNSKDVCVVGNLIYLADGSNGLEIIQMTVT